MRGEFYVGLPSYVKTSRGFSMRPRKKRRVLPVLLVLALILCAGVYGGYRYFAENQPYDILLEVFDRLCSYKIDSIDMKVEFDPEDEILHFTSSLHILPQDNPRFFAAFTLSDGLDIDSLSINGQNVPRLRIWLLNLAYVPKNLRNGPFTLQLTYSGIPTGFFDRFRDGYVNEKGAYLSGNDLWFPFMFEANKTKTADLDVTCTLVSPPGYLGVTAGLPMVVNTQGITVIKWTNACAAAVVFHEYEEYAYQGLKTIRIFVQPEYSHRAEAVAILADDILKQYTRFIGEVEPDTLNIAFLDKEHNGTFYNGGLIVLGVGDIAAFDKDPDDRQFYKLLAHEIGHLWWHSEMAVKEALSGNQWYVEGFTEYASMWSAGRQFGAEEYLRLLDHKISVLRNRKNLRSLEDYTYWEYSIVPYYQGTLMLDSLRRLEGDEKVFQFMNAVRVTPEIVKDTAVLNKAAVQVFDKDYSLFFDHWMYGAEPVKLSIVDLREEDNGDTILLLDSSHTLSFEVDIELEYFNSNMFMQVPINKGLNEVAVLDADSLHTIRVDPHRRLFRMDSVSLDLIYTRDLATLSEQDALIRSSKSISPLVVAAREGRKVRISDVLSHPNCNWINIDKSYSDGDTSWTLEKFLEAGDAYWAVLSRTRSKYTPAELDVESFLYGNTLSDGGRRVYASWPQTILREELLENDVIHERFLLRRERGYAHSSYDWAGGPYTLAPLGVFSGGSISFETPMAPMPLSHLSYSGPIVVLEGIRMCVEEVSYNLLTTNMRVSFEGTEELVPVRTTGSDIVLPDGTILEYAFVSTRTTANGFILDIDMPLNPDPLPMGIRIHGLVLKRALDSTEVYMDGETLWVGLKDKVMDLTETTQHSNVSDKGSNT
jgi:hypothetical protein